jgi:hypothetical protein
MVENGGTAFGRWGRMVLAVVALAVGAQALRAQGTTGKVEGTVTDPNGQPVAGAQVAIRGTALGAVTNSSGYYFINHVPTGTYTMLAVYIGFQPAEVRNVRVLSDQTLTVDIALQGAVRLGEITVTVQQNPIVPRDQVATKSIVSGATVQALPIDNLRQVLAVQPGVVESGKGAGLSIRGGRPGEAAVYVDGAIVRSQQTGSQRLNVGTNSLEEASITTGALGAEFSDAQSGLIAFNTRAGGPTFDGAVAYETDEMFGDASSVGLNRAEVSLGGPLFANLTFFLSGTLHGQQSDRRGKGWAEVANSAPSFVMGGLDTSVTVTTGGQETTVDIPQFIRYSGDCEASANLGVACQGQRLPYNWSTSVTGQAKLQYTYGSGSRASVTFLNSQDQDRGWNSGFAYQRSSGTRNWSNAYILNWTQQISRSAERALAFDVNLSYQTDKSISGPFTQEYEQSSRSPFNGWSLKPMDFVIDFDHFSDDTPDMYGGDESLVITQLKSQSDWDRLVRNVRTNQGTRTPYLDRNDLRNAQPYRMNPWGLATGYSNNGWDVGATLLGERRLTGRANVDFQFDRYNRFKFGGDLLSGRVNYYSSGVLRQSFMDVYAESPKRYGAYAEDRLDLGDVVIELGVRWDYFDTGALLSAVPGRIFTDPLYDATDPDASLGEILKPVESHTAWSPRVRVSFPVTDQTGFRLSYSHQVQSPDFATVLTGINNDLSFTNTNDIFGRDVTWGKTILFEFGVRHAFTQDFVFDISAYNKDKVSDLAARIDPFFDPLQGDSMRINILTNADFGNVRGVDVNLVSRFGDHFNGQLAYTLQVAKNTGSDPFSYLRTTARQTSAITGDRVDPPQAVLPTDDNRTHNISGSLSFAFPNDFGSGAAALLRNAGAFVNFRIVSGLPYTRLKNAGNGNTAPFVGFGLATAAVEPINASTMPWTKQLDLRVTKGLRLAGLDWTAYADFRNLLNLTNITRLFAETGDVHNDLHRSQWKAPELSRLEGDAGAFLTVAADGSKSIQLPSDCSKWPGSGGEVNCVLITRAEQRFGNGDGVYTEAEYNAAFDAEYDLYNAPFAFYGSGRQVRLGLELRF